jgi:hypothetical protein
LEFDFTFTGLTFSDRLGGLQLGEVFELGGEQAIEVGEFLGRGLAGLREPPGGADLRVGVVGVLLDHAGGEVLGAFDDELVVEQEERLRGDRGDVASLAVRIHVR